MSSVTTPYQDPAMQIDWSAVDRECWWLPPDALSLSGVPEFEALPRAVRQRLSQYEYIQLLQTGLWLEALFIERLALLAGRCDDPDRRAWYLREIREEAGHSLMFGELIRRSGIALVPARSGAVRWAPALGRAIAPGSALYWALVVAGEEVPNRLNIHLLRGVEEVTLSTVVYRMARIHVRDESTHAALARAQCEAATKRLGTLRRELFSIALAPMLRALSNHLHYPPPAIYERAGLHPVARWRSLMRRNPVRQALAVATLAPTLEFLRRIGLRV
jgi:hypothetical protein